MQLLARGSIYVSRVSDARRSVSCRVEVWHKHRSWMWENAKLMCVVVCSARDMDMGGDY
jgi:hypothetical protein